MGNSQVNEIKIYSKIVEWSGFFVMSHHFPSIVITHIYINFFVILSFTKVCIWWLNGMCTRQYLVFCLFIIAFFMTKTLERATPTCTQIPFIISFIYVENKNAFRHGMGLQPIRGLSTVSRKCLVMKLREYTTYNLAKLTFHFCSHKKTSYRFVACHFKKTRAFFCFMHVGSLI